MNRTRRSGNLGLAAATIGFALAAIGLGVYQAWWTIAFAAGGLAVSWADARGAAAVPAVIGGLSFAAVLALGILGMLLAAMGIFGRGRPGVSPGDNLPLLLLGLGVLTAAVVGLAITTRFIRRASEDTVTSQEGTGESGSRDKLLSRQAPKDGT
jgi:hypothetical protein